MGRARGDAGSRECTVDRCERPAWARGLCPAHYQRWRTGRPLEGPIRGYGLGRQRQGDGYIHLLRPDHPLADNRGRVLEHRLVMWEAGLMTDPGERVHHRNETKDDNRIENLEVTENAEHSRAHAWGRGTITNQYGTFEVRKHGSASAYKRGCRCSDCTQANTVACRAARARRRQRAIS